MPTWRRRCLFIGGDFSFNGRALKRPHGSKANGVPPWGGGAFPASPLLLLPAGPALPAVLSEMGMVEWWALLAHPSWRSPERWDGPRVLCDGAVRGGCGAALLCHQAANPTCPHPSTVGDAGCSLSPATHPHPCLLVLGHPSSSMSPYRWPPIPIQPSPALRPRPAGQRASPAPRTRQLLSSTAAQHSPIFQAGAN